MDMLDYLLTSSYGPGDIMILVTMVGVLILIFLGAYGRWGGH